MFLPIEPFRGWLVEGVARTGSIKDFAERLGVDEAAVRRYLRGTYSSHGKVRLSRGRVTLDLVDRWMTAAGESLTQIYPLS